MRNRSPLLPRHLHLRFRDPHLEQSFRIHYDRAYFPYYRLGFVTGTLIFLGFGLLDYLLLPDLYPALWRLRFLASLPLLAVSALFLLRPEGARHPQAVMTGAAITAGWSIVAMIFTMPPEDHHTYLPGLMLVIFFVHTFIRLRFWWALAAGLAVTGSYELFLLQGWAQIPREALLANQFFLLSTNFIGMGASYAMERDARRQFRLLRRLSQERNRLKEANRSLRLLNERLDDLAHMDELSGIPNRRSFFEHLEREWRRQVRALPDARPIALLIIDIDFFKNYNDYYGHPVGDHCLQRVAEVIARHAQRPADLAARIGGEEFVLLLPESDLESAIRIAEQLRDEIAAEEMEHAASEVSEFVTVSIGVAAESPDRDNSPAELLRAADRALYRAKRAGRNRVST